MSSMLSRFVRRQGKNLKKHGPKMLGLASMLGFNPLGMLGKTLGGLGGGKMTAGGQGGGGFFQNLFGGGGASQGGNIPLMMNQDYLQPGGSPGNQGGFFQNIGQNLLGLGEKEAKMGGFGMGLMGLGTMGQFGSGYDKGQFNLMNKQLAPLQQSADAFGDLGEQYMDPNSQINQQIRDSIRGRDLSSMDDVIQRNVSQSTGTYGDPSQKALSSNVFSDAIGAALSRNATDLQKRFQIGGQYMGQQSQLNNALSQARTQNLLYAQQQRKLPFQYMGQTGAGLLQNALYQ